MVLSQIKQSPSGTKKLTPRKGTPAAKSPKGPMVTPGKAAPKRPLDKDDGDSEDSEIDLAPKDNVNGVSSCKKPRLSLVERVPQESDDDDDGEDDDDDDDEDDDGDDDEDDGDDDEEDEDDDDEEGSDDDDAEDESESNDEEMKDTVRTISNINKLKSVSEKTVSAQAPKAVPVTIKDKSEKMVKTDAVTASKTTNELDAAKSHFLIPRPPRNLDQLKTILAGSGINVSDIHMLHTPVAIAVLEPQKDVRSRMQSLSFDGSKLHVIELHGPVESIQALDGGVISKTLFIVGIPKSVSSDALKTKLPSECRNCTIHMLTTGPRNKVTNAAYLNFESPALASAAMRALRTVQFNNQTLRVSYGRDSPADASVNTLRGLTKTLKADNLPAGITEDQLKVVFSTAKKMRIVRRKFGSACFIDFASNDEATKAFDAHNNGRIGQSTLNLRFVPSDDAQHSNITVEVFSIPPGTDQKNVLALFPGAISAAQLSNDHLSISFASVDDRRKAVQGKKMIGNTKLRITVPGGLDRTMCIVKNLPFDCTEQQVRSLFPDANSVSLISRENGKPTGKADVVFSTFEACQKATSEVYTLQGRSVQIFMKNVNLDEVTALGSKLEANLKPTQKSGPKIEKPKQEVAVVKEKSGIKPKRQEKDSKTSVLPQVGSASEDEDEDEDEEQSHSEESEGDNDEQDDDDDEDEDEDEDDYDEEEEPTHKSQSKLEKKSGVKAKSKTEDNEESDDEEEDGDDDDDNDEEEDGDDDEDEDDDGDEQESEDEGIDEDEEMPMVKQEKSSDKKKKFQSPNFQNKQGISHNRGRGSFGDRGDYRGGGNRGRGFGNRGGNGNRGFKHGDGQRGGGGRGGGGFRGRGNFTNRGRGQRGQWRS